MKPPGPVARNAPVAEGRVAGFVLAGGHSTRMGRDKALLAWNGSTLVETVASKVLEAAGNVTVIAPEGRYDSLGLAVVPDLIADSGPLGGLYTALHSIQSGIQGGPDQAEWALLTACDMPYLTADFLGRLIAAAAVCGRMALVPRTVPRKAEAGQPFRIHPLCGVYHRSLLPATEAAIGAGRLKMQSFVSEVDAALWDAGSPGDADCLRNLNSPADLAPGAVG